MNYKRLFNAATYTSVLITLLSTTACGSSDGKQKGSPDVNDITAENGVTASKTSPDILGSAPFNVAPPYSIYDKKVPDRNYLAVYVANDGRVALKIVGDGTGDTQLRKKILAKVIELNEEATGTKINLSGQQIERFAQSGMVGTPLRQVGESDSEKGTFTGIPYEKNISDDSNICGDLQLWLKASMLTAMEVSEKLHENLRDGSGLAVVADGDMNFMTLQQILDNFDKARLNHVSIVTSDLYLTLDDHMGVSGYELQPDSYHVTPYLICKSDWSPQVVDDYANNTDGISSAKGMKTIASDIYEEEEIEEEMPEEELMMEPEMDLTPFYQRQIAKSRSFTLIVSGNFPQSSWCDVQYLYDGSSSGRTSLFGENSSDNRSADKFLLHYNRKLIDEISQLKSSYFSGEINAERYESRKKQLYAEARELNIAPVVLIRPAKDATLSTTMAAISMLAAAEIPDYYIITE